MRFFKKKNKDKNICTANNNKPECSLIKELRDLQKEQEETNNDNICPRLCKYIENTTVAFECRPFREVVESLDRLNYETSTYGNEWFYSILNKYSKDMIDYYNQQRIIYNKIETINNRIDSIKKQLGIK